MISNYLHFIWMDQNDLNGSKINKQTGISKSNVSDWVKDKVAPFGKGLLKLTEHYYIPIEYILTGSSLNLGSKNY